MGFGSSIGGQERPIHSIKMRGLRSLFELAEHTNGIC